MKKLNYNSKIAKKVVKILKKKKETEIKKKDDI